jgi:hypothetical protein
LDLYTASCWLCIIQVVWACNADLRLSEKNFLVCFGFCRPKLIYLSFKGGIRSQLKSQTANDGKTTNKTKHERKNNRSKKSINEIIQEVLLPQKRFGVQQTRKYNCLRICRDWQRSIFFLQISMNTINHQRT